MNILVIGDVESKYLWEYFEPSKLKGVDLIISCGDLNPNYLSFLATFTSAPVLYVHGNHDEKYDKQPPEGCISIEDKILVYNGVRILGLGGSMRYKKGKYQYTEREMRQRVIKMFGKILKHKGFDILVTHAPAFEINDGTDLPHRGFKVFIWLIEKYNPKYYVHGHVHMNYGRKHVRYTKYKNAKIINAYERHMFEYES